MAKILNRSTVGHQITLKDHTSVFLPATYLNRKNYDKSKWFKVTGKVEIDDEQISEDILRREAAGQLVILDTKEG